MSNLPRLRLTFPPIDDRGPFVAEVPVSPEHENVDAEVDSLVLMALDQQGYPHTGALPSHEREWIPGG